MPLSTRPSTLVALAITVCMGTIGPLGTLSDATAQQRPDCENFLDQEDAQVAFDADPTDPFDLDETGEGNGEACEKPEGDFGTPPLVNCDDLRDHPDIARALYDHSLTKYGADRYELTACIEQGNTEPDPPAENRSNEDSSGDDPEVLDGVPPESGGTVIVSPVSLGTGQSLEARLEARFTVLEAQFAAFEARAANGFGIFPESGDDATAAGQAIAIGVSTFQQPITTAHRANPNDDRPIIRAQKAKEGKDDRTRERKGNRNRHKDTHRNRR